MTNLVIEIQAPQLVTALMALAQAMYPQLPSAPATVNPTPMAAPPAPAAVPAPQVPVQTTTAPTLATPAANPAVAPPAVPVSPAPEYTLEQLATAATPIVDAGRRAELTALLQSFGIVSLPQLPKEQYGAFATALRGLGAKI